MSYSYTVSEATTFTITHARHMAAKVVTDLKRLQRFYGAPSDGGIAAYGEELTMLMRNGYLRTVTYGFRRNNAWIEPTVSYTARDLAGSTADDHDPGRIRPGADTTDASFYSYLTYSSEWNRLFEEQKEAFRKRLPFRRTGAPEPAVDGYLYPDRTYSAGGRALDRVSVRTY